MGKITFWYCDYCEKEVEPSRKPLDSFQKTIWAMIVICTIGFGLIALFIYNKFMRKKKYCPTCETILKISEEPFEKPKPLEDLTPKERVLVKSGKKVKEKKAKVVEDEEEEEEKKIFCPFSGEELKGDYAKRESCPFCQANLSDRIY